MASGGSLPTPPQPRQFTILCVTIIFKDTDQKGKKNFEICNTISLPMGSGISLT